MLDAIFSDCYGRWGGRFNLIAPCENGEVRPAYLPWLEAYDPDIIYSYVDLSENALRLLHERLCPSFLTRHEFYNDKERDIRAFHPQLKLEGISSLSVAVQASQGSTIQAPQPVNIVDTHIGTRPGRFLQDNFGCYGRSMSSWPIARDIQNYVRPITFVPEAVQANRHLVPRVEGEIVNTEAELLEQLANKRNLYGLAQLSAWQTPRLEINDRRWAESISLIVGNTFADSLVFWNARSHLPVWIDSGVLTLKIDPASIEDENTFTNLVAIIKNRIQFHAHNNAMTHFVLRSVSLDEAQLNSIRDRFKGVDRFNLYTTARLPSVDDCVPHTKALANARSHVGGSLLVPIDDWHEVAAVEKSFRPPTVLPRHIRDVASLPSSLKKGIWALDLDIQRSLDHSHIQNISHHWRLPRRVRVDHAFLRGYQLDRFGGICMPRVNVDGLLTVFASANASMPEIKEPSDDVAFRTAFCVPNSPWPFARDVDDKPKSLVYDMRPSDKGRYLTAILRMTDGVTQAGRIFLNQFWRQRFAALGADAASGEERIPQIVQVLKEKKLKSGAISTEADWERIAGVVLSVARNTRNAERYLRYDALVKEFDQFRNAYWAENDAVVPPDEEDEDEKRSLADSIQYLCGCEILHQGHEWHCRHCYNRNWVRIDALTGKMTCEVCGSSRSAPVSEPWYFRLNGFVRDALRDHGVAAAIWCLCRLQEQAKASFYFSEAQELYFTPESSDARQSDAEFDLLTVTDGITRLCEIKTSRRGIDVTKLAELAKRVRPHFATLAVMEPQSAALGEKLDELKKLLDGSGIEAELICLAANDIEDAPFLPNGRQFSVRVF